MKTEWVEQRVNQTNIIINTDTMSPASDVLYLIALYCNV